MTSRHPHPQGMARDNEESSLPFLSASSARFARAAVLVAAVGLLAACESTIPHDVEAQQAVLNPITAQNAALRSLPSPSRRVAVAVYGLPDVTGQYAEPTGNVQSLSRAVTQGGGDMLIKALQDAGERRWFSVLDRSRLDDTLKERQIVTEMRRIYRNEQQIPESVLPPLQHAGIIIQGGITGYDSYTRTGGAGARYLGIGGSTNWQQDTVTVTLRAVSTNTSEVLASVTVHKDVASVATQAGVFRYVQLDRVLELEAGVTRNEPRMIAVQQAIEKAVVALVIEGAELKVWDFANRSAGDQLIAEYRREKYGQDVPAAMHNPPAPETRNAAAVVPTRSRRAAPRPVAATPEPAAPAAPPPGGASEVLG